MTFRVGQKVVCVDAMPCTTTLVENAIYTVDRIYPLGIVVVEIPAPGNNGFFFRRFRPVVERKTDISIFTEMLTKTGVDA